MSTARFNNAGAVGTGTTVDNMQSRVKAYVATDTAQAVAVASYNISSLTDLGGGASNVNLASAMASANYAVSISSYVFQSPSNSQFYAHFNTKAAGNFRIHTGQANASADFSFSDMPVDVSVCGVLA